MLLLWEWGRLYNEELRSLYRLLKTRVVKSRRLKWVGHVARMDEGRSNFNILTGKHVGNRLLGSTKCRCEDHIRMDLKEIFTNT